MSTFQFEFRRKPSNPRPSAGWFEVMIDGQSISHGYHLETGELIKSFEGSGDYWLLNCSCGVPECAGLYAPFHVTHLGGGVIHWHIEYPEPEREFYFSKGQAIQALITGFRARDSLGIDLLTKLRSLQSSD